MKSLKLLTIILSIILISGCAMMPTKPPADPNNPMKRIAILPIKNDTTDVDGPNFVREKLIIAFEYRDYNVKPVEETDRLLRDRMGRTCFRNLNGFWRNHHRRIQCQESQR